MQGKFTMRWFGILLAMTAAYALAPSARAEAAVATFEGAGDDYNLLFNVHGAWELRWKSLGNETFPSVSHFEVHLYDSVSGRFLTVAAQKTGSGRGVRHFADGGSFFINVRARNVRWQITIVDVDEPWEGLPEFKGLKESGSMDVEIITDPRQLEGRLPKEDSEHSKHR